MQGRGASPCRRHELRHALDVAIAAPRRGRHLRHDCTCPGAHAEARQGRRRTEAEHVIRARVTEAFPSVPSSERRRAPRDRGRRTARLARRPNDGRAPTQGLTWQCGVIGSPARWIRCSRRVCVCRARRRGRLFAVGRRLRRSSETGAPSSIRVASMLGTKASVLQSDSADRRPDMMLTPQRRAVSRVRASRIAWRWRLWATRVRRYRSTARAWTTPERTRCCEQLRRSPRQGRRAGALHARWKAVRVLLGGQFAIVRELRRRGLAGGARRLRPTPQPYELACRARAVEADTGRLGRAQGCLLGQIAGDALRL